MTARRRGGDGGAGVARLAWLGAALALGLAACGPDRDGGGGPAITVTDARVPEPAPGASTAAAYLTVSNSGEADDRLLGVECDAAGAAMLHETVRDGDMMRMEHRPEGYAVPAGRTLALEPGGRHIMLHDLDPPLEVGQSLTLRLRFEREGIVELAAQVVPLAP